VGRCRETTSSGRKGEEGIAKDKDKKYYGEEEEERDEKGKAKKRGKEG